MDQLFLISYRGTITTLGLFHDASAKDALRELASTRACEPNPSWISLDAGRRILYCTEGGMATGKGALKAFRIESDGSLTETSNVETPCGAAHHTLYNNGNAIVVAYYYAGYVGTYNIANPTQLKTIQEMTFQFDTPGPGDVQNQPRPHHTVVDPTGRYILSVDLGADMVRVFRISVDHQITEIQGLNLSKGDFPRHVAFVSLKDRVQLYVLLQDTNALLTYRVEYPESGGLKFFKEDSFPLLRAADGSGVNHKDGVHIKASHLDISPDGKFLLASLRYNSSHTIPSPLDPRILIPSDTIFSYRIDPATGALSQVEAGPSGGRVPRQFSLNATGDKIAVVSQRDGWVSIFERNIVTGKLGKLLGVKDGFGAGPDDMGPVCILWDTPKG